MLLWMLFLMLLSHTLWWTLCKNVSQSSATQHIYVATQHKYQHKCLAIINNLAFQQNCLTTIGNLAKMSQLTKMYWKLWYLSTQVVWQSNSSLNSQIKGPNLFHIPWFTFFWNREISFNFVLEASISLSFTIIQVRIWNALTK